MSERIAQLQELQATRRKQIEEQKARLAQLKSTKFPHAGRKPEEILEDVLPSKKDLARLKGVSNLEVSRSEDPLNVYPFSGETYEKSCQTAVPEGSAKTKVDEYDDALVQKDTKQAKESMSLRKESMGDALTAPEQKTASEQKSASEQKPASEQKKIRTLTDAEVSNILHRDDFKSFFDSASRLVEKQLLAPDNTLVYDYTQLLGSQEGKGPGDATATTLLELCELRSERLTESRPVNALSWSPHFPDLLAVAYGSKSHPSVEDDPGLVCIWSLALPSRPEFTLTSGSPVLTVVPDKTNPAIFYGSSYSGTVQMWDTRAPHRSPVQRTPLISTKGHNYPVYSLAQMGDGKGNNLVSISTDGKACTWTTSMLVYPTETVELRKGARELCVTAMARADRGSSFEGGQFWVGAEDGSVTQIQLHDGLGGGMGGGSSMGKNILSSVEPHEGPVTAVACHPMERFSDLVLTSSFDWSVNLYSTTRWNKPLLSLSHYEEYVTDVCWHPNHPAVFMAVDAGGALEIFNLNKDLERPRIRYQESEKLGKRVVPWHRCAWDSAGKRVAAGNIEGKVSVLGVRDPKILAPKVEDEANFLYERLEMLLPDGGDPTGDGGVDANLME